MRSSILLLGAVAAGVGAVPAPHNYQVHERRDVVPHYWTDGKRLDGSVSLPVRIGLTQSNLDHGHDLLMDMWVKPLNLAACSFPPPITRADLRVKVGPIFSPIWKTLVSRRGERPFCPH